MTAIRNFQVLFFVVALLACSVHTTAGRALAVNDGKKSIPPVPGQKGVAMRVLWTVSGYLPGKNALWDEKVAKAMLFKPLDISSSRIVFDGQICEDVVFEQEEVDALQYLEHRFQVTPQELGITGRTLQVVRTNCRLPGFAEYVRLQDNRLVVPIQGVLYIFAPAVDY